MATVLNQVKITQGKSTRILTQPISTNNNTSKIISIKDDSGTELFKVERQTNGDIKLSFDKSANFVDDKGATVTPPQKSYTIKAPYANDVLKLCERKNPSGVITAGQELEFQVNSNVKIKANARSIEVERGGVKYFCNAAAGKSLGMNISVNAIEDWLEGRNGFEKATDVNANFPLPVLGLFIKDRIYFQPAPYARTIGNFNFQTLPNPNNALDPYVFVQNKGKTCLYTNGQLKTIRNFIALHDAPTNNYFFALECGRSTYFQLDTDAATASTTEAALRGLGINNITDTSKNNTVTAGAANPVTFEDADSRKTAEINFKIAPGTFSVSEDSLDGKISDILMLINIFKEEITIIINSKADENLKKILDKLDQHENMLKEILKQTKQNSQDIKKIDAAVILLGKALEEISKKQDKLEGIVNGIDEQVKANGKELKEHGLKIDEILKIVKGLEGVPGKLGELEKALLGSIKTNGENFDKIFEELKTLKTNQGEMRKTLDEIIKKLSAVDTLSADMKELIKNLNTFKNEVNQKFDKLEKRIDNLEKTFKTELNGVNKRLDKLDANQVKIYNILSKMGIDVAKLVTETGKLDLSVKNIEKILTTLSKNFETFEKRTNSQLDELLKAVGLNTQEITGIKNSLGIIAGSVQRLEGKVDNVNSNLVSLDGRVEHLEEGQEKTNQTLTSIEGKLDNLEQTTGDLLTVIIYMMNNPGAVPGMTTINNTTVNNTTDIDIFTSSTNIINQTKQSLIFLTANSNANVQGIIKLINQSFDNISVCIDAIKKDESQTLNLVKGIRNILQNINDHFVELKKERVSPIITMFIEQQIKNVTATIDNIEIAYNKKIADEAQAQKNKEEEERVAALPDNAITSGFNIDEFNKKTLMQMLTEYNSFLNKIVTDAGNTRYPITHEAKDKTLQLKSAIALQQKNLKALYVQLGKYNDNPSEETKEEILKLVRELRLNQKVMRDYKDELKNMKIFDDPSLEDDKVKKQLSDMSDSIDKKTDKVLEKAEEMQKDKEEEKEEEGPTEVKHEHKKEVEYLAKALFPISAVLIALACLTPLGIFALIPGIALMATCVITNAYSDKFNYSTWEYAHKQLTEQEQQELEDQEQLGKFMEKQAELEKAEEKIKQFAHGVPKLDENGQPVIVNGQPVYEQPGLQQSFEDATLAPIMNAYNQYGIGFNATPNPNNDKRPQLLGQDGHEIRKGMHEQLAIITDPNTSDADREAAAQKFIDDNFGPELPDDPERKEILRLLMSTDPKEKQAVIDMTTRMGYLNAEEDAYLALLSESKVDIAKMPDYLIARALGSAELDQGNRRERFLDRYGPTLVRRYAINEGLSQAKLDMLFSKVPESARPQCVEKMEKIAQSVFSSVESLENFSEESKKKHNSINTAKEYGHAIAELSVEPNQYYTRHDAANALTTVIGLELYRDQLNEINKTDSKLDSCKIAPTSTSPTKSTLAVDKLKTIQPVDDNGINLSENYKIIYECAVELGIKEILLKFGEMGSQDPTPIDRDIDGIISIYIKRNESDPTVNSHPTFIKLKEAFDKVNSPDIEQKITNQSFIEFKNILASGLGTRVNIYDEQVNSRFEKIQEERQNCINAGKEYKGEYWEITDEPALKAALFCELFINDQVGGEKEKYQKIFNLIKSGAVAKANKLRAKNNGMAAGLGITPETDIDAQINREVQTGNNILHGAYLTEDLLQRFPLEDRQDIVDRCMDKMATNPSAPFNKILRLVLVEKYGKETTPDGKTYEDILKECTDNSTGTPRIDTEKLDNKLNTLEAKVNAHEAKERSCCESQLGKQFTSDIYNMVLNGDKFDALDNANLDPEEIIQEQDAEKRLNAMKGLRAAFTACWEKAINVSNPDIQPLINFLAKPSNASIIPIYDEKLQILRDLGIDVDTIITKLQDMQTRLASASTEAEKKSIIAEFSTGFNTQEQIHGYILTSKEVLATQIRKFDDMRMMHRATNETDEKTIAAMSQLETAVDEATTVSAKLRVFHMLKASGKLSEAEFKKAIVHFAKGEFTQITSPHLRGYRFSKNDPAILAKIGITPENIADLTLDEITEKVKKYIDEQSEDYKALAEEASGETERGQEKADGSSQPVINPKRMKNRISLVARIFGNINENDKLSQERKAERERLGIDKTVTYEYEAAAGAGTIDPTQPEKTVEGEAESSN